MTIHLHLLLNHADSALLRALDMIERRGYGMGALQAQPLPGQQLQLDVEITHEVRPVAVLVRQLAQIPDVIAVHSREAHTAVHPAQSADGLRTPFAAGLRALAPMARPESSVYTWSQP